MTLQRAKTIQIFLPNGNPRGIRIAEVTVATVQATLIPRADINIAKVRPEVQKSGVYFLFSNSEGATEKPKLYIGEAENCYERLLNHHADNKKDFWVTAIAITSKTSAFTKAHARFLEWYCHEVAVKAGRYDVNNTNTPKKPGVPEPMEAELLDCFDVFSSLISTLGFPVFDQLYSKEDSETLFCNRNGNKGLGKYTEDGFILLKGSVISKTYKDNLSNGYKKLRSKLLEEGSLIESPSGYELKTELKFNTPSGASDFVIGSSANGWVEWKYKNGKTLDEVVRKAAM